MSKQINTMQITHVQNIERKLLLRGQKKRENVTPATSLLRQVVM